MLKIIFKSIILMGICPKISRSRKISENYEKSKIKIYDIHALQNLKMKIRKINYNSIYLGSAHINNLALD